MKKVYVTVMAALISVLVFAQDGGGTGGSVDVNVNTNEGGNWYANPWIWVIGGAVFVLLLVALTRGGGRRRID